MTPSFGTRTSLILLAAALGVLVSPAAASAGEARSDGPYTEKWPNGQNKVQGRYRGGQLDGPYAEYDEKGRRLLACTYRAGKLHGRYETWTPEGKRRLQSQYDDGRLHGRLVEFAGDGYTPARDEIYVAGRLLYPRSTQMIAAELRRILGAAPGGGPFYAEQPSKEDGKIQAGRVAPAHLAAALARLKAYRYLAGVPYEDISLNDRYSEQSQHAAVLLSIIGSLTHSPSRPAGVPEEFFKKGHAGCSNSNLAMGRGSLTGAVDMWMNDSDKSNIDRLGHRRWCINPSTQEVGFGTFGRFSAMWALDRGRGKKTPDFDHVAYPVPGYQPVGFFGSRWAWNVSLNPGKYAAPEKGTAKAAIYPAGYNFEKAPRALELDYENISNAGFGVQNCVIFRPKALSTAPGSRYWVELTGIKTKDGKDARIEYIVEFVP